MLLLRLVSIVLTLAWGLWFGGIMTLFLAVTSLFNTFAPDRALAGTAAASVFRKFERYQLVLAAVTIVAAVAWRMAPSARRGAKTAVLVFVLLAAVLAPVSTFGVSARIGELRTQGLTATGEFRRLHGISMALYATEAVVLLLAGLALSSALAAPVVSAPGPKD